MSMSIFLVLLILAVVCFLIAAFAGFSASVEGRSIGRLNFVGLGLALLTFALIVKGG